ncbi:MAG: sporulation protein YabP [Clostridia bacterium]
MTRSRPLDEAGEGRVGAEATAARKRHQLVLKHRKSMAIDGVLNVESFDNHQVLLETDQGVMVIRGEGLHIRELNLEGGSLLVDGFVHSIEYVGDGPRPKGKAKGLLGKIFR